MSNANGTGSNILNHTNNNSALNFYGGTVSVTGSSAGTNGQQFKSVTLNANTSSKIAFNQNGATSLSGTLNGITRGNGAVLDFVLPTSGNVTTTSNNYVGTSRVMSTASPGGAAYATVGGAAWATIGSSTPYAISALTYGSQNSFAAGADSDVTGNQSPSTAFTVNTLRFNSDGATLTLATGANTVTSGGILVTPNAATTGVTISGGTLAPGSGNELVFINNGKLTVNSAFTSQTVTIASSVGYNGVSSFGGNNTISSALYVTSGNATFSGANNFNGATVNIGYGATLTLSGANTANSSTKFAFGVNSGCDGGTLVLTAAGALGNGVIDGGNVSGNNFVKFASDSSVSNGSGSSLAAINLTNGGGFTAYQTWIMDRATPGLAAVNETFTAAAGGRGFASDNTSVLNILQGSNYTTGFTTPTITFQGGATPFVLTTQGKSTTINAAGANVSITSNLSPYSTTSGISTFQMGGTTTGNTVSGNITDDSNSQAAITKIGTGTWTLSGNNTNTGATTVNGGTLVLDYSTNATSKIATGAALNLSGGVLALNGGNVQQTVGSTTIGGGATTGYGQTGITQTGGGSSTISLGAITFPAYKQNPAYAGSVDFSASNIATTTSGTNNCGILSARATVGGATGAGTGNVDWATVSGGNIIALPLASYAPMVTSGGFTTSSYILNGNTSVTLTGATTLGSLKIAPGADNLSLNLSSGNTLTLGSSSSDDAGLLFTGSYNFTINGGAGNASNCFLKAANSSSAVLIQDWATGILYLNDSVNYTWAKYGTGKMVLGVAGYGNGNIEEILAGTVQYSAANQFSGNVILNGSYGPGAALVAATSGGGFTSTNTISLGAQGGNYIDVIGGNALTLSGVISGNQSLVANNIVTFGGASAVDSKNNGATNGTIILSGANTYQGGTTFAAGTVQLNVAENAGFNGPLGAAGTLTFTGGTLQYSANNTFDYSSRFSQVANQAFNIDTNSQNVTFATGLAGASSTLTKLGAGMLTLSGANTYSGATTVTAGTLQLNGSLAAGSTVGVATAGTLSGSGTASGNATLTGAGAINLGSTGNIGGTLGVTGGNWIGAGSVTGAVTSSSGNFNIGTGANLTATGGLNVTGGSISSTDNTGKITGSVNYTSSTGSMFAGVIANGGGASTLTMNSAGTTLTLNGANTYSGGTTVQAGTLIAGVSNNGSTSGAFGPSADGVTLGNASTSNSPVVLLIGGAYTVSNPITVANYADSGLYTIGGSTANTATFSGNITLNQPLTIAQAAGGTLQFSTGTWTAGANAISVGTSGNTGTVKLSNSLVATGGVNVNYGTLLLGAANALGGTTTPVTIGANGTLDVHGYADTVQSLGSTTGGALDLRTE